MSNYDFLFSSPSLSRGSSSSHASHVTRPLRLGHCRRPFSPHPPPWLSTASSSTRPSLPWHPAPPAFYIARAVAALGHGGSLALHVLWISQRLAQSWRTRSRRRGPPHCGDIGVAVAAPWTEVWTAAAAAMTQCVGIRKGGSYCETHNIGGDATSFYLREDEVFFFFWQKEE